MIEKSALDGLVAASDESVLELRVPESDWHVWPMNSDFLLDALRTRGFILMRGLPARLAQSLLHGVIGTVFKAEDRPPQSYRFGPSLHGVYLPLGHESVSAGHFDSKAVFDVFPSASYTYQYYRRRAMLEDPQDEAAVDNLFWRDFHNFRSICGDLLQRIATLILSTMGIDESLRHPFAEGGEQNDLLRFISYPKQDGVEPSQHRLGAHKDDDLLALVANDSSGQHSGLQLLSKDGSYANVTIPPDCALVLAGQLLETLTGGAIMAPVHRVIDSPECRDRSRHTLNYNFGLPLNTASIPAGDKNFSVRGYYAEIERKYKILKPE